MDITDEQLTKISEMMDGDKSEKEIIAWVESQENSEQIFEWFNKFMQGYAVEPKEEKS